MATKVLKVPTDTVPLDPMQTIRKVHWGSARILGVSLQIFPSDAFLISASGSISINGTVVAPVLAFPPTSAGCGTFLTPAQLAELFAPEPVPDLVTINYSASWDVRDALLVPQNGVMFTSADTYTSLGQSELIDNVTFEVTALSGGGNSFTLNRSDYSLS
jgi:hypothetical protein